MLKVLSLPIPAPGTIEPQPRGAHTRHGTHPLQQGFVKCVHLPGGVVFVCRKAVAHGQHVVGRAAQISRPLPPVAFEQKAGGDEQDHSGRNLHREQRLAQRCARPVARRAS